jgi:hypothetical protein
MIGHAFLLKQNSDWLRHDIRNGAGQLPTRKRQIDHAAGIAIWTSDFAGAVCVSFTFANAHPLIDLGS